MRTDGRLIHNELTIFVSPAAQSHLSSDIYLLKTLNSSCPQKLRCGASAWCCKMLENVLPGQIKPDISLERWITTKTLHPTLGDSTTTGAASPDTFLQD